MTTTHCILFRTSEVKEESSTKTELKKEESESEESDGSAAEEQARPEDAEVRDVRYKLERLTCVFIKFSFFDAAILPETKPVLPPIN